MYNEKIEQLIKAALADGVLTEKEKQVLFKNAQAQGIDLDEFEIVLDARLVELQKSEKEKAEKSAPKSSKYGDVRECPVCGTIIGAFQGACQNCGFEFSGVDANLSSKKLYEALDNVATVPKKKEIIETFPIPNTKADLLEFLTSLKPRILDVENSLSDAYYKKYAECIEKAKASFANDKQLRPFIEDFNQFEKTLRKKKIVKFLKKKWKLIAVVLFFVFVGIFNYVDDFLHQKAVADFAMHISNGDAESAKSILKEMDEPYYDGALDLIKCYISKGDVYNAIDVYEKLTPGHCSMFRIGDSDYRHGSNGQYEIEATNLIRKELIKIGEYDLAWYYSEKYKYADNPNSSATTEEYYKFMTEVVNYLCGNNNKQEARKFINKYIQWFSNNVDVLDKSNGWYKKYNSQKSKTKLLQIINNY